MRKLDQRGNIDLSVKCFVYCRRKSERERERKSETEREIETHTVAERNIERDRFRKV